MLWNQQLNPDALISHHPAFSQINQPLMHDDFPLYIGSAAIRAAHYIYCCGPEATSNSSSSVIARIRDCMPLWSSDSCTLWTVGS